MIKKFILLFLLSVSYVSGSYAQELKMEPVFGMEMARIVSLVQIEEATYENVLVELKSSRMGAVVQKGVRIKVWDTRSGKELYKGRFPDAYLYVGVDGIIQVAKGTSVKYAVLFESEDEWVMKIKKEGLLLN